MDRRRAGRVKEAEACVFGFCVDEIALWCVRQPTEAAFHVMEAAMGAVLRLWAGCACAYLEASNRFQACICMSPSQSWRHFLSSEKAAWQADYLVTRWKGGVPGRAETGQYESNVLC